ncbi:MAG: hypothetical protein FJY92_10560, partial [Candidatus Hydrogenedentes bacterium]|nr:hypothetical protein [Candidatus Hydrogenedentota bacterium]
MSSGHDDTSKEDLPDGASETAPVDSSAPNLELTGQADLDEKLVKPVFDGSTGIETAQVWIGAFLIAVAGLIAYSNSFALPMHYPDRQVLLDAPGGLSVVTAPAAAKASGVALLPMVTLALNMWLGVGALFHAVNVALHVINGVLVYFLARRLLGLNKPRDPAHTGPELSEPVAMLGGLLMALHPLATESVNLAIGRAPLLGATFSIGAVLLVLRAADRAEGRHIGALLGAGVCLAVGYACDVAALFVPAFALAADWVANGGGIARRAPAHAALWAMTIALGVWGLTAARTDQDPYAVFEPEVMVAPPVKAAAYSTGLTLAVNPIALSIEHDLPPSGFFDAQAPGANPVLTSTTAIGFGLIALILIGARSAGGLGL